MNLKRTWAMARKETIQLKRDPRSLILAFVLPLLLVALFGYAITLDVRNIELATLDYDHSRESRELIDAFEASGYFRVVERLEQYRKVEELLALGRARAVLIIPAGLSRDLAVGRAEVQLVVDGGDANTATISLNYAEAIMGRYAQDLILAGRSMTLPVEAESRVWYNETLESRNSVVPGLIAVIMSIIAAMLTALTIAREWERGTMEQLAATPVHRVEVVIGKLLPYIAIGLIDVATAVVVGRLLFQVPFNGSVLLLSAMTLMFLLGVLGFGLFISATVKSQVLASQMAIMSTYLPALLLSGFLFAIANMPWVLQMITLAVPARYFVTVTRGIFLKGVGIEVLWPQGLAMAAFATIGLSLAIRNFKKELA